MNDDTFSEFMLGAVVIGISLMWIYPGSALIGMCVMLLSLMGVFFLLKGAIEFLMGSGTNHLWMGAAMLFTVVIMFKSGMGMVLGIFSLIAAVIGSII